MPRRRWIEVVDDSPALAEAVAAFEASFAEVHPWNEWPDASPAKAPNGTPYEIFTHGGVKEQGEPMPSFAPSIDAAVAGWLEHVAAYARACGGRILCWRSRPELAADRRGWAIYSRLAVVPSVQGA